MVSFDKHNRRPISERCLYSAVSFLLPLTNLVGSISGEMLVASNGFVATFALFLFCSFAEISQTNGNQPRNGVEGMLGLNLLC